ncbi:MAG TPA: metallophosphoesterase [Blastocatellia bacterium]|nr:metallophosphoesterase [Blastocatellia bacterium]
MLAEKAVASKKRFSRVKAVINSTFLIIIVLGLWTFWIEPSSLTVNRTTLQISHWPAQFNQFKIVAISDLHVGAPYVSLEKLKRIVEMANAEQPDLIVLLGDYVIQDVVGGNFIAPEDFAPELGRLKAKHGVYAVLGNHDWWLEGPRIKRSFEGAGVRVLSNEAVRIAEGETGFWLAGIDDFWSRHHNISKTLNQITTKEPIIALNHSPDIFPELPDQISLTLCGHTHGGQVNIPWLRTKVLPSRYGDRFLAGHIEEDGKHLFVTKGIGTSGLPARFLAAPEIAVLTVIASE